MAGPGEERKALSPEEIQKVSDKLRQMQGRPLAGDEKVKLNEEEAAWSVNYST